MKNGSNNYVDFIIIFISLLSLFISTISIIKANEANEISIKSNNLIEKEIDLLVRPILDVNLPQSFYVTKDEYNELVNFDNFDSTVSNLNEDFTLIFENIGNDLAYNVTIQLFWANFQSDTYKEDVKKVFSDNYKYSIGSKNYLQQGENFKIDDIRFDVQLKMVLEDAKTELEQFESEPSFYAPFYFGSLNLLYYWENKNDRRLKASYSCWPLIFFYEDKVKIDFFYSCIYDLDEIDK